jgi:uncharacterized membrane protein
VAAQELDLTTPYPAVAVEPGGTTTFDLKVTASGRQRVDLTVSQKPDGWTAILRGGGFVIDGVFTDPGDPPGVQLEVNVPQDVQPGTYRVVVRASSPSASDSVRLELRVAESVPGGVTLASDFPQLRGTPDQTFPFDVQLTNSTSREITFSLETAGPEGWQVDARPTTEQLAATVRVAPGGTETISVTADPPDDAVAGIYQIGIQAVGGGQAAQVALEVEITGSAMMTLATPDQRLNAEATAGGGSDMTLLIQNQGTAPLTGVSLTASPPTDWEVTFSPESIEAVLPGEQARVIATIRPAGDAVAGDYVVSVTASTAETSESVDIRTTVKTSFAWGGVGIALIVAAIAGLVWVFRRYGRR